MNQRWTCPWTVRAVDKNRTQNECRRRTDRLNFNIPYGHSPLIERLAIPRSPRTERLTLPPGGTEAALFPMVTGRTDFAGLPEQRP